MVRRQTPWEPRDWIWLGEGRTLMEGEGQFKLEHTTFVWREQQGVSQSVVVVVAAAAAAAAVRSV